MTMFHASNCFKSYLDMDSKSRDSDNVSRLLRIQVDPSYLKAVEPTINEFGPPKKEYYTTADVCIVLGILPDIFRERINHGHYPEYKRNGIKRIFTLGQTNEVDTITKNLLKKGMLLAGIPD